MKNLTKIGVMIVLTALASSCKKEGKVECDAQPVRVKTMTVDTCNITGSRSYSGTVEESNGTSLSFSVAGTVRSITVSEGDRVAKGQLIGTLDDASLQNAYEMAKATLDNAQDAYNRMKMLHDANSLPDMQWVEVQNALRQAQSAEAIARKTLNDARLYAPFSGYVSEKMVDAGMTTAPGLPVVKLVTINPVKVSVSIPENEISSIGSGGNAVITCSALGGAVFSGRMTEKAVTANPLSHTYDVKLTVDNPDAALLPGMICEVVLEGSAPRMAMVLPVQTVLLDADNQNFVWLYNDGVATKRIVTVDGMTDDGIVISGGLEPGDIVITEGLQKVSEGTRVASLDINENK